MPVVSVFVSLFDSIKKNLSVLNHILPSSSSNEPKKSKSEEKLSKAPLKTTSSPSASNTPKPTPPPSLHGAKESSVDSSSTHKEEGLFPNDITINNELFSNVEFTQCSNAHSVDELAKMIKFTNSADSNTLDFKFDINSNGSIKGAVNEFLTTPSPSSVEHNDYSSASSASSLNNLEVDDTKNTSTSENHARMLVNLPNAEIFDNELKKSNMAGPTGSSVHLPTPPSVSSNVPATIKTTTKSLTKPVQTKDKEKTYICEYCNAEFKIRGYLTRHIKKHAINKAYECPFFDEHSELKCHPNGGFSRRDTYKTHLKSRHFKYPKGTRLVNRTNLAGNCGLCDEYFSNNEDWIEHHIENGECKMLPKDFKIRVKNSRNKFYEFPNLNKSNEHVLVSPLSNGPDSSTSVSPSNTKSTPPQHPFFQTLQPQSQGPAPFQQPYNMYQHQVESIPQQIPQQQQYLPQQYPLSSSANSLSSGSSGNAFFHQLQAVQNDNYDEILNHFNYGLPQKPQVDFTDEFSLDVESSANYSQFATHH